MEIFISAAMLKSSSNGVRFGPSLLHMKQKLLMLDQKRTCLTIPVISCNMRII